MYHFLSIYEINYSPGEFRHEKKHVYFNRPQKAFSKRVRCNINQRLQSMSRGQSTLCHTISVKQFVREKIFSDSRFVFQFIIDYLKNIKIILIKSLAGSGRNFCINVTSVNTIRSLPFIDLSIISTENLATKD